MSKIIDKWKIKDATGLEVVVPVRMATRSGKAVFEVSLLEPLHLNVSDADINKLRADVTAAVSKAQATPWEKKIVVTVSKKDTERADDEGLGLYINYRCIQTNTTVKGEFIYREGHGSTIHRDEIQVGDVEERWNNCHDTIAILDDTPENEAVLKSIIAALGSLADRVRKLMHPKTIVKTLSDSSNLLSAPKEK